MKDKIIKSAGKRGKTKYELADKLQISYSACSAAVNALVKSGDLVVTGKVQHGVGRPAIKFGAAK